MCRSFPQLINFVLGTRRYMHYLPLPKITTSGTSWDHGNVNLSFAIVYSLISTEIKGQGGKWAKRCFLPASVWSSSTCRHFLLTHQCTLRGMGIKGQKYPSTSGKLEKMHVTFGSICTEPWGCCGQTCPSPYIPGFSDSRKRWMISRL